MRLVASRLYLQGIVQGCGVRPAIVRLARQCGLTGWVENNGDRVLAHAQGTPASLQGFVEALPARLPAEARLDAMNISATAVLPDLNDFVIRQVASTATSLSLPDIPADRAVCQQCLQELRNPQSRRYGWPFIACSACGPRYAWLKALPFLRANTTFSAFSPCPACQQEYNDSDDRRFGMELIACDECGPQLFFVDKDASLQGNNCFPAMVKVLQSGGVVALQGFSGFQLLALASNADAVSRLRRFKARQSRPLALLARRGEDVAQVASLSEEEHDWIEGSHRPIVLLKRNDVTLWPWVAAENPRWGIMLPAHGMHALLLDELVAAVGNDPLHRHNAAPVMLVATSANRRGEPIAGEVGDLLPWLGKGIDAICHHSVPVWQVQDDSVLAVLDDGPVMMRRARGFAHEIIAIPDGSGLPEHRHNVWAEGAFLKTTLALQSGGRVLLSQYLGDMDSARVVERKREVATRLAMLCGFAPDVRATDAHPDSPMACDIGSSDPLKFAEATVFHHRAHVAALMAESGALAPALVAAWDGLGYGEDGQWWGSEVFAVTNAGIRPVLGLQAFRLPGGDRCAGEPWRVMAGLLLDAGVDAAGVRSLWRAPLDDSQEWLMASLESQYPFPCCTSMGRFLEGVSALLLGAFFNDHEGHAASRLEYAACLANTLSGDVIELPLVQDSHGVYRWQWQTLVAQLWARLRAGQDKNTLARMVLESLAESLITACRVQGVTTLGVSGGCFQNLYWLDYLRQRCAQEGIRWVRPKRFPPNDGAIALGQVMALTSS